MNEIAKLIDQLIAEHKVINQRTESMEMVANDASLLSDISEAKDTFMPGRFDQSQNLKKLGEMLADISTWLDNHFNREETILLTAVEQHGDRKFVSALNSLLLEHSDLRNRVGQSRDDVNELTAGGLARHRWEASANDMRAHLSHTRKLLEAHAATENELFADLRRIFKD